MAFGSEADPSVDSSPDRPSAANLTALSPLLAGLAALVPKVTRRTLVSEPPATLEEFLEAHPLAAFLAAISDPTLEERRDAIAAAGVLVRTFERRRRELLDDVEAAFGPEAARQVVARLAPGARPSRYERARRRGRRWRKGRCRRRVREGRSPRFVHPVVIACHGWRRAGPRSIEFERSPWT